MVFVLDATALHRIPSACGGAASCGGFLNDLGDLVAAKAVCFCRASVTALKELAPDGVHYAWARTIIGTMWGPTATWQHQQQVVNALEGRMDFELLDGEIELTDVLALATVVATATDEEVVVVTEDDIDKVDVLSMISAASELGFHTRDLSSFAEDVGLDSHFP